MAPNTSRVAILEVRCFRTNRFCGDCDNPTTRTHDKGRPLFEWKTYVDEMGREYPVCTPVLTADKDKVFTDADVTALRTSGSLCACFGSPTRVTLDRGGDLNSHGNFFTL